jgi:hypothetical protein
MENDVTDCYDAIIEADEVLNTLDEKDKDEFKSGGRNFNRIFICGVLVFTR